MNKIRPMLINWGLWTLFGVLQAASWLLSPIGDWYPNALKLFAVALFNAYMWALLTPFVFRLASRVAQAEQRRVLWATSVILIGVSLAAVVALLAASAHGGLPWFSDAPTPGHTRFSFWALSRWYLEELVLFFLVFGAGMATEMFRTYRRREQESARLQAQASVLEAERADLNARLAEARLAVLRSQLNPHFLFNTLNAVSALVVKNPAGVRDMIALLSELLRSALTETDEQIPLSREMELLRLYLDILEIRYQGQLRTRIVVDDDARDAMVPRMILQPLVENAMKHGVAPASGEGVIEVQAQRVGNDLVLRVRDSGATGGTLNVSEGVGVGLRITRQRLSELYGDQQSLVLMPADGGGTIAQISLPYHTRVELHHSADGA